MKTITANNNQTLFDLSLQTMGSIEGIWSLLDANPGMVADMSVPAGTRIVVPQPALNARVVEYYARYNIMPVSGLDEEMTLTFNDMNTIPQILDYDLAGGSKEFNKVWLNFLHDVLTVQMVYEGITANDVVASVDQSLDGINWTPIPYVNQVLDKTKPGHTWNIYGLLTNYVRLHVQLENASAGIIKSVTWKT
jgi:hypothetical protein